MPQGLVDLYPYPDVESLLGDNMAKINWGKYVGLPYKAGGRNFDGTDCYGIAVLVGKEELGIDLPDFTELLYDKDRYDIDKKEDHILRNLDICWARVKKPYKIFDCLIFNSGKDCTLINHIGIYIGNNKFIHIIESQTSMISSLDNPYWENKVYGVMRVKGIDKKKRGSN